MRQRITLPFLSYKGSFVRLKDRFFYRYLNFLIKTGMSKSAILFHVSPFTDTFVSLFLRDFVFFSRLGLVSVGFEEERVKDDFNKSYVMNTLIADLSTFHLFLFLCTVPRFEAPVLDLRLRVLSRSQRVFFLSFGSVLYASYAILNIGNRGEHLLKFISGKRTMSFYFDKNKVCILKGMLFYQRTDVNSLENLLNKFLDITKKKEHSVNLVSSKIAACANYEIGLTNNFGSDLLKKEKEWLVLFGVNNISYNAKKYSFILSIAHHISTSVESSDLVFPSLTAFEQLGLYANMEGKFLQAKKIFKRAVQRKTIGLFICFSFFSIFFKEYRFLKVNKVNSYYFAQTARRTKVLPASVKKEISRVNFILPVMFRGEAIAPNILGGDLAIQVQPQEYKLDNTLYSSYHRFYYSFDIYSSNSFTLMLAHRRFSQQFIGYKKLYLA